MKRGGNRAGRSLFARHPKNPILTAERWPYPVNTVFNPAATLVDGETLLLVRVEERSGRSHLTVARSKDGKTGWRIESEPTFVPEPKSHPEELYGIEDARVTWLEERAGWAVTYTAVSSEGPLVALALTNDFRSFRRMGPIMRPVDKDAALFPRRFGGRWALLHRPVVEPGRDAHIWLSMSPDLTHWGQPRPIILARKSTFWDSGKIGLSPGPLETPEGWLVMYHGVRRHCSGAIYRVGLALLDLDEPWKVVRRSPEWVMGPREPYEMIGDVGQVIFPCGWVHDPKSDEVRVYYGGADTCVCEASASMRDLLDYMRTCPSE